MSKLAAAVTGPHPHNVQLKRELENVSTLTSAARHQFGNPGLALQQIDQAQAALVRVCRGLNANYDCGLVAREDLEKAEARIGELERRVVELESPAPVVPKQIAPSPVAPVEPAVEEPEVVAEPEKKSHKRKPKAVSVEEPEPAPEVA